MLLKICMMCLLGVFLWELADGEVMAFAGIKLRPPLSTSLMRCGYGAPLPIQAAAIPLLTSGILFPYYSYTLANLYIHMFTSGLSCILHAETGSGKTLAYLLPLLKRLINHDKTNTILPIQSLIIVPTKVLTHSLTHSFVYSSTYSIT